jgi:hypothetical protein
MTERSPLLSALGGCLERSPGVCCFGRSRWPYFRGFGTQVGIIIRISTILTNALRAVISNNRRCLGQPTRRYGLGGRPRAEHHRISVAEVSGADSSRRSVMQGARPAAAGDRASARSSAVLRKTGWSPKTVTVQEKRYPLPFKFRGATPGSGHARTWRASRGTPDKNPPAPRSSPCQSGGTGRGGSCARFKLA